MVRRRWPDVIIVAGIVALGGLGVWALWGDDLRQWLWPTKGDQTVEPAKPAVDIM
jgi:hypothetical protein